MANITKSKLTEVLKSKGLSEGFISNFFNKIAKDQLSAEFAKKAAKDAKEIDQLQKKSDQKKADIKAQLLKTYGSMDKVPQYIKTDLKSILGKV